MNKIQKNVYTTRLFIIGIAIFASLAALRWTFSNDSGSQEIALQGADAKEFNSPAGIGALNDSSKQAQDALIATIGSLQESVSALIKDVAGLKANQQEFVSGSSNQPHFESEELEAVFREVSNDSEKMQRVLKYHQDARNAAMEETDTFFDNLADVDPAWSSESTSYLNEAMLISASAGLAAGQFKTSECKGNVCKIEFYAPVDPLDSGGSDKFTIENEFVITVGKKFPRSRFSTRQGDGGIVIEGYLADRSVRFPESSVGLSSKNGMSASQIRAVLEN